MRTIIILITIYILSTFLMWLYFHLAHGKNGIFKCINPESSDIAIVFIPILNTVGVLCLYAVEFPIKNKNNYNNFFKIKK